MFSRLDSNSWAWSNPVTPVLWEHETRGMSTVTAPVNASKWVLTFMLPMCSDTAYWCLKLVLPSEFDLGNNNEKVSLRTTLSRKGTPGNSPAFMVAYPERIDSYVWSLFSAGWSPEGLLDAKDWITSSQGVFNLTEPLSLLLHHRPLCGGVVLGCVCASGQESGPGVTETCVGGYCREDGQGMRRRSVPLSSACHLGM